MVQRNTAQGAVYVIIPKLERAESIVKEHSGVKEQALHHARGEAVSDADQDGGWCDEGEFVIFRQESPTKTLPLS